MEPFSKRKTFVLAGLAVLAYVALFFNLGALPFVGADEPRYARIGEEMILRADYITPTLEFRPWLEKPPLLYWGEVISFKLFGISEWSARFPNALLALIGIFSVALFTLHIRGERAAMLAFAIMTTSLLWIVYGRAASTDLPLAATLTMAMLSGYQASRSESWKWTMITAACLGLATLAKGPMAVVLFLMVFVVYALLIQKEFWSTGKLLVGTAIFLLISGPWYILVWIENGENFFWTFWINHHLARFVTDIHHHQQPIWFYIPILIAGIFPWSLFLGPSIGRIWQNRFKWVSENSRIELFLWLWVLVPLVFFSISKAKLPGYILPILPGVVVLAAIEWDRLLENREKRSSGVPIFLSALGSISIIIALVVGFYKNYGEIQPAAGIVIPLLISTFLVILAWMKIRFDWVFFGNILGISATLILAFVIAVPALGSYHSPKAILAEASPYISAEKPLVLYRYFQMTAHYYSGYRTTKGEVFSPENLVEYINKHPQTEFYLLTQDQGLKELKTLFKGEVLSEKGNLYLVKIPEPD